MSTFFSLFNKDNLYNYVNTHKITVKCLLFFSIILIFSVIFTKFTKPEEDWYIFEGKNTNSFYKNMIHFSFTTFSTTGYGDVLPTSNKSRNLTHLMMFFAFLVAVY